MEIEKAIIAADAKEKENFNSYVITFKLISNIVLLVLVVSYIFN
jgi:hypothetical protein